LFFRRLFRFVKRTDNLFREAEKTARFQPRNPEIRSSVLRRIVFVRRDTIYRFAFLIPLTRIERFSQYEYRHVNDSLNVAVTVVLFAQISYRESVRVPTIS